MARQPRWCHRWQIRSRRRHLRVSRVWWRCGPRCGVVVGGAILPLSSSSPQRDEKARWREKSRVSSPSSQLAGCRCDVSDAWPSELRRWRPKQKQRSCQCQDRRPGGRTGKRASPGSWQAPGCCSRKKGEWDLDYVLRATVAGAWRVDPHASRGFSGHGERYLQFQRAKARCLQRTCHARRRSDCRRRRRW